MVPGGVLCFFGSLVSNRDKLADYRNITKRDGPRDSKNPRRSGICDKLCRMDANPNFAEMATDDSNLDRIRKTEEVGNFLEAARGRAPKRSSTTMATSGSSNGASRRRPFEARLRVTFASRARTLVIVGQSAPLVMSFVIPRSQAAVDFKLGDMRGSGFRIIRRGRHGFI